MDELDIEYVEDICRVRRPKNTHYTKSAKTPDWKCPLLNDEGNNLVTQAVLSEIDEDELRNLYAPCEKEIVYVEQKRDEQKDEIIDLLAELLSRKADELWEKHGDDLTAWLSNRTSNMTEAAKLKASDAAKRFKGWQAGQKEKRRAKKTKVAHSEKEEATIIELADSALDDYQKDMDSEEAKAKLLRVFVLAAELSIGIEELSHANIVGTDRDEVLKLLSKRELITGVNGILEAGPAAFDEKTLGALQLLVGRSLYENGVLVPICAEDLHRLRGPA